MGSGRFVGGFEGTRGVIEPTTSALIQRGSEAAGGADGWLGPVLGVPTAVGCAPVSLHADGTTGTYTLAGLSVSAIILSSQAYDFTCSPLGHVKLDVTVTSRFTSPGFLPPPVPEFPKYGIFVRAVVPPANQLFTIIPPDVQVTTAEALDRLFHTFTATNTIVNPGAPRFVIFAVAPDFHDTPAAGVLTDWEYKNFIVTPTGV